MQQNIGSSLGKAKQERLFVDFLERRAIGRTACPGDRPTSRKREIQATYTKQ